MNKKINMNKYYMNILFIHPNIYSDSRNYHLINAVKDVSNTIIINYKNIMKVEILNNCNLIDINKVSFLYKNNSYFPYFLDKTTEMIKDNSFIDNSNITQDIKKNSSYFSDRFNEFMNLLISKSNIQTIDLLTSYIDDKTIEEIKNIEKTYSIKFRYTTSKLGNTKTSNWLLNNQDIKYEYFTQDIEIWKGAITNNINDYEKENIIIIKNNIIDREIFIEGIKYNTKVVDCINFSCLNTLLTEEIKHIGFVYHYNGNVFPFFYNPNINDLSNSDLSNSDLSLNNIYLNNLDLSYDVVHIDNQTQYKYFNDKFIDFLYTVKTKSPNAIIDLLTCNLNKKQFIDEVTSVMNETGVKIRYSINNKGNLDGADWIQESDNIDIKPVYFNDNINNWKHILNQAIKGDDILNIQDENGFIFSKTFEDGYTKYNLLRDIIWNSDLIGVTNDTDFIELKNDEMFDGQGYEITIQPKKEKLLDYKLPPDFDRENADNIEVILKDKPTFDIVSNVSSTEYNWSINNKDYKVQVSSVYGNYPLWYGFDGILNHTYAVLHSALNEFDSNGNFSGTTSFNGVNGWWVKLSLNETNYIDSVLINSRPNIVNKRSPKNFYVFGSNDNNSWNELLYVSNAVWSSSNLINIYKLTNPGNYQYLTLVVTAINGSDGNVNISEIDYFPSRKYIWNKNSRNYSVEVSSINCYNKNKLWNYLDKTTGSSDYWYSQNNFYDTTTGKYNGNRSLNGISGEWLKYEMYEPIISTGVEIYPSEYIDNSPREFKILASNDNINWTELFHRQDENINWYNDTPNTFTFGNTIKYKYYAIIVLSIGQDNTTTVTTKHNCGIGKISFISSVDKLYEIKQTEITNIVPPPIDYVSNSQTVSILNNNEQFWYINGRKYHVKSSSVFNSDFQIWKAFNNNNFWHSANSGSFNQTTGQYTGNLNLGGYNGEWFYIGLDTPLICNKVSFKPRNRTLYDRTPRSFYVLGSVNDDKTWELIENIQNTSIYWIDGNERVFDFNNNKAFRYYAIVIYEIGSNGLSYGSNKNNVNIRDIKFYTNTEKEYEKINFHHEGLINIDGSNMVDYNKSQVAQNGGVDIGTFWISSSSPGNTYLEADLMMPQSFGSTDRHVIFETGGDGAGAGAFIYDQSLVIVNGNYDYNNNYVLIGEATASYNLLEDIHNILGTHGTLGMEFEYTKTNYWIVRLYWNDILLTESEETYTGSDLIGGGDNGGYLHYTSGMYRPYFLIKDTFTPFPNSASQGNLKVYNNKLWRDLPKLPIIRNVGIDFTKTDLFFKMGGLTKSFCQYFKLENCYSKGNLVQTQCGGLCGSSSGRSRGYIINCYHIGDSFASETGLLIGAFSGTLGGDLKILNSYAIGDIYNNSSGIIAGKRVGGDGGYAEIKDCYAVGNVYNSGSAGIVATQFATYSNSYGKIVRCYHIGELYNSSERIWPSEPSITGIKIDCFEDKTSYDSITGKLLNSNWSNSWDIVENSFPILKSFKKHHWITSHYNLYNSTPKLTLGLDYNINNITYDNSTTSFNFNLDLTIPNYENITYTNGKFILYDVSNNERSYIYNYSNEGIYDITVNDFNVDSNPCTIKGINELYNNNTIVKSYPFSLCLNIFQGLFDGVIIDNSNIRSHIFNKIGNTPINVSGTGKVELLVVAGGGSGGTTNTTSNRGGGGGGAGGLIYNNEYIITGGVHSLTVGTGGSSTTNRGNNGGNSSFSDLIAYGGGGGGGGNSNTTGMNGGSGGGGGDYNGKGGNPIYDVTPDKTIYGKQNLGSYWIGSDKPGSTYLEAFLTIPTNISNHVIWETGGNGYGAGVFIYNSELIISIDYLELHSTAKINIYSIPNFIGYTGKLGMGFRNLKDNIWQTLLFWNDNLLIAGNPTNINTNVLGGGDGGSYLGYDSTIVASLNSVKNTFVSFPNQNEQGYLRLFRNRYLPPFRQGNSGGSSYNNNINLGSSGGGGGGFKYPGTYGGIKDGYISPAIIGKGGEGLKLDIEGDIKSYANGGDGGLYFTTNTGNDGMNNTGNGGQGSSKNNTPGSGGSGMIALRYNVLNVQLTAPLINSTETIIEKNSSNNITLTNTDFSNKYNYVIIKQPNNGVATITNNIVNYIPEQNYVGKDSFTYQLISKEDNTIKSNIAIINIYIPNNIPSNPILYLNPQDLNLQNETKISNWNGYSNLNSITQPTYFNSGGYSSVLPYVKFENTRSTFLNGGTKTLNISSNGGFTFIIQVKFRSTNNWERIIDFANGPATNNILLAREKTTNNLTLRVFDNGSTVQAYNLSTNIINGTWQTFIFTYDYQNNKIEEYDLSGDIIKTTTNIVKINNRTVSNSYVGRSNWNDPYADYDLGLLSFYDKLLTPTEIVDVLNNYNIYNLINTETNNLNQLFNSFTYSPEIETDVSQAFDILNNIIINAESGTNAETSLSKDIVINLTSNLGNGVFGATTYNTGEISLADNLIGTYNLNGTAYSKTTIVLLHELFHMLGIGISQIWNYVINPLIDTTNSFYNGTNGVSKYKELLQLNGYDSTLLENINNIPIEDNFGSGTKHKHLEEGLDLTGKQGISRNGVIYPIFKEEIMTGFLNENNYLTKLTLGLLEDIGYNVDYSSNYINNNIDFYPKNKCLFENSFFNLLNTNDGYKMMLNGELTHNQDRTYGIVDGTYNITNIPKEYPITLITKNNPNIVFIGDDESGNTVIDGITYTFYYGKLSFSVTGIINEPISIYCKNNGYCGGYNILLYSSICSQPSLVQEQPDTTNTISNILLNNNKNQTETIEVLNEITNKAKVITQNGQDISLNTCALFKDIQSPTEKKRLKKNIIKQIFNDLQYNTINSFVIEPKCIGIEDIPSFIKKVKVFKPSKNKFVVDISNVENDTAIYANLNDLSDNITFKEDNNNELNIIKVSLTAPQYEITGQIDDISINETASDDDIKIYGNKRYRFGGVLVINNTTTTSGDPYITTINGKTYKLNNKGYYRLLQGNKNSNLIINAYVKEPTKNHKKRIIKQASHVFKQITNKMKKELIKGTYYHAIFIQNERQNIVIDFINKRVLSNDKNLIIKYKKSYQVYFNHKINCEKGIINLYNKEHGNIRLEFDFYNIAQIENGFSINLEKQDNIKGLFENTYYEKDMKVVNLYDLKRKEQNYNIEKKPKIIDKREKWLFIDRKYNKNYINKI